MITDERIAAFIESFDRDNTEFLYELEMRACRDGIPVIKKPVQSLIRLLLDIKRPERILEVGTAVGFSSILMAEYGPEECHITTIEKYQKRISTAKENLSLSGYGDRIALIEGDAADVLCELRSRGSKFDFIFMDAAKGQYINFLEDVTELLDDRGILLSDNVLQDGDVIESRYAVTRRNRTIHSRMREYLFRITHDPCFSTVILPIADGVTISTKRTDRS